MQWTPKPKPDSMATMWRPFRLDQSEAHQRILALGQSLRQMDVRQELADDANRVDSLSWDLPGLHVDASKQRWNPEVKNALCDLAREADLKGAIGDLFGGVRLNSTENRAVLHMALRANQGDSFEVDGQDVLRAVLATRSRMLGFVDEVLSSGRILDVVNIGIGGSDLGPAMAVRALRKFRKGPRCHFVSNVDGAHVESVLASLNPATTLIVVVSKTFTTQETMANARIAKRWLEEDGVQLDEHLAAVSTNLVASKDFGIAENRVFGFEDWVGGRYSMWGPVGLSIALSIGSEAFLDFLAGARAIDVHVQEAEMEDNLPVQLALLGHWNQHALNFQSHVVIPYAEDLCRLPAYLQQADMESNGKFMGRDGQPVDWPTGTVVWGEPGTNSQHAFFQLLHQGTGVHPVDFVAFKKPTSSHIGMHKMLLSNALAQAQALLQGRPAPAGEPHRAFQGNRPSSFFLFEELNPFALGQLIAIHEHRIFCQGVLWGIASFDQWGVELGKVMANELLPVLNGEGEMESGVDASTRALISKITA